MTDYKEEQTNEIAVLESIYPEELTILSNEPTCFSITVCSEDTGNEDDDTYSATLQFTYTPTYPDDAPIFEVTEDGNVDDEDRERITQVLQQQIDENLGMAMVFTLVTATQEFLNGKVDEVRRLLKEEQSTKEAIEDRRKEEEEERLKGTLVTIESFLCWKELFDQERMSSKQRKITVDTSKKLTGRELFERDHNLDDSDMAFLDDGDNVEVDESLFQNLDDLDLDIEND